MSIESGNFHRLKRSMTGSGGVPTVAGTHRRCAEVTVSYSSSWLCTAVITRWDEDSINTSAIGRTWGRTRLPAAVGASPPDRRSLTRRAKVLPWPPPEPPRTGDRSIRALHMNDVATAQGAADAVMFKFLVMFIEALYVAVI